MSPRQQKIVNDIQGTLKNFMEINLISGYAFKNEGDTITVSISVKPEVVAPTKNTDTITT